MDQITIAFAFADTEAAQQLAAGLRTCGFVVQEDTEAGALSSGAKASSRCTIIIWSEASCDSSFVNDRAVRAAFRNVVVPLRSREFPLQSIPAAYRRVRPNILPGLPLIIPDNRTELGVFADGLSLLWPARAARENAPPVRSMQATRPARALIDLMPGVFFLACCVLIAIAIDSAVRSYNPYSGVTSLHERVTYVSTRRKSAQTLEWLKPEGTRVQLGATPPLGSELAESRTIFVHGYNVSTKQIPGYFNDLIGSLEAHGRTGTSVVFDWPSGVRGSTAFGPFNYVWTLLDSFLADTVSTELEMYDIGRRTAEGRASDALAELVGVVHQRNGGRAIDIVAHSMGCYLLLQALRKHPTLSSRVGRIVMLAPAFQSSALEEPVTLTAIGAVPEVHIYHSRHDAVLRLLGSVRHATSMMGAVGISSRTRVPTSIRFHDVSDVLRSGDVHGAYLKTTGIEATGYWALLRP